MVKKIRYSSTDILSQLEICGFSILSKLSNSIKEKNIYDKNTIQYYLWIEFTEKNIPFLIVLSNYIYDQYIDKKIKTVLFSTRDCVFLKPLFNKLYPEVPSDTFYSSRALYLFPPNEYIEYCKRVLTHDSMVIDFQGTGQSFKTLVSNFNLEPWYLLVNWNAQDKMQYSNTYLHNYDKKIIIRKKNYFDDAIEKLNIDLIGTYFDYHNGNPIAFTYEYDPSIMVSLHRCFEVFVNNLDSNIDQIKNYKWTQSFNEWMDKYYVHGDVIANINWIHTHFKYDKETLSAIREQYRHDEKTH
jgi:hypothetical protein